MSKKKLVPIQRYLIIAILFLLCIALALGILIKYQNSQDVSCVKLVHLPLAAIDYNKPELDTLNPNDSKERIFKKIKQIKKDFKDLRYINNHTGSLFTSNEEAMRKLYEALKNQNIFFVDSKTIGNSKANKIAKELNIPYIQRDVFLDSEDDVNYVKKQLENAVKLAQKKGFAIAIGYPRKNTFKALEQSKDLLKGVELVYLSEIYGK